MGRRRKPPSLQQAAHKGEGAQGGLSKGKSVQSDVTLSRVSPNQSESIVETMKAVFSAKRSEANSGLKATKESLKPSSGDENRGPITEQRCEDPVVCERGRNGDDLSGGGSGAARRLEMPSSPLPWAKVAAEKSMTAKGSSLKFVAPTVKEGKLVAQLDKNEVNHLAEVWAAALIVYVVGNTPSIGMIIRHIEKEWNCVAKPQVYLHEKGYFVVKFQNIEDRNEILYSGPHMLNNRPMIIKAWSPDFNFHDEMLRIIPLWVRLPNLPLSYWSMDSLSRIGSMVGVPLYADECTTHQKRISFARLLIEVDVTKPLPQNVMIVEESGRMLEQRVRFEWAPSFCKKCQVVGHDCIKKGTGDGGGKVVSKPLQKWVAKPVVNPTVPVSVEAPVEVGKEKTPTPVVAVGEGAEEITGERIPETKESPEARPPPWNIVTRGQKGKEVEYFKGPGVVTHMVDEAGSSSFTVTPG